MAILHLGANRILGSSTAVVTPTYETDFSSGTSWTVTNTAGSAFSIAGDMLSFGVLGQASNNGSQAVHDLGSTIDTDEWVLRFKIQSTGTAINGNSVSAIIAVGLFSGSNTAGSAGVGAGNYSPTQNYSRFMYHRQSGQSEIRVGGADNCTDPWGCGETNSAVDIGDINTTGYYYVEGKKTSATSITWTVWSDSYGGTQVGTSTQDSSIDTSDLRYIKVEAYHGSTASGQTNTISGDVSEFEFYNGVTSVTTDEKATLVTTASTLYTEAVTGASVDLFNGSGGGYGRIGVRFDGITPANIGFVKVHLRKIGTHTDSNVITCNVRNISTGNSDATATLTAGDLTGGTTVTEYTFTFSSPVAIGASTQRILIEYPYGDATNYLGLTRAGTHDDVDWTKYDGSGNNYTENTNYSMSGTFGLNQSSDLPENTIFIETNTKKQFWLQSNVWKRTPITPTNISDLYAWYDATDITTITKDGSDRVSKWENKEGTTARDLVQTTSGNRPLWLSANRNGKDVIDFSTSSTGRWMKTSSAQATVAQPISIVVVVEMPSNDSTSRDLLQGWQSANTGYFPAFNKNSANDGFHMSMGTSLGFTETGIVDTWQYMALIFNTTSSELRMGGVQKASGNAGSTYATPLRVGVSWNNDAFWNAKIMHVVFYDKLLSASEIEGLESWASIQGGL